MSGAKCPYCECEVEIDHDDGYGYEEDKIHQQECEVCAHTFIFTTQMRISYELDKANCLNGGKHKFKKVHHSPEYWPEWSRCEICGVEKGKKR